MAVAMLAGASGCVSADKFKKEIDGLKAQVADLEKTNQEKTTELSKYQSQLANTSKEKTQLRSSLDEMNKRDEAQRREFTDLQLRLKKLSDAGTLSVKMIDGKLVVNLGSDILFPSGSAKLSREGLKTIAEVAQQLKTIPDKKFQVEGHTDNVPISTAIFPSNWELASARSVMVVKEMIKQGFSPQQISAATYADFAPIQSNDTKEGKAANRRIAIVIIPDLSVVPGLKEMDNGRGTTGIQTAPQTAPKAAVSAPIAPSNTVAKPTMAAAVPAAAVQAQKQSAMPKAESTTAPKADTKKPAPSAEDELE